MKLLLVLLLVPALGASPSSQSEPAFVAPGAGSLTGRAVAFELALPPPASPVRVLLDGVPLDRRLLVRRGDRLTGTLGNLEPGVHELDADVRVRSDVVRVTTAFEVVAPASFQTRGSVGQVFVTHAQPGGLLELVEGAGGTVAEGLADFQGSLIFRELTPGAGYRVVARGTPTERSDPVAVLSAEQSTPPRDFYTGQVLAPGYGYITTRDGTRLSVYVSLPGPPENGPYPTLINYSGYEPSQPGAPLRFGDLDLAPLCAQLPVLCDAPNHPSGLIAGALGYATVGVNMRGTGCSGGAYDFFEPLQLLDGYDIVETVAAQDWVAHNHVGMAGLSFPGISQLFVASVRPPSLAAITPLSVISGTDTVLGPGGILNDGFAVEWGQRVLDRADPYGQGWEQGLVDAGDTICEENQLLHSQKVDIIQKALDNPYYVPEIYDPLNPRTFVDRIDVPVFTSGAWQDEQTGGHFPDLWNRFDAAPVVRMTGYNGAHADGYTPQILAEWKNFLDFYVAREILEVPPLLRGLAPFLFDSIFGAPVGLPEARFAPGTDFEAARAAYEAEPDVRIIFESGGGSGAAGDGAPEGAFELAFPSWPPPETTPQRFFLNRDGSLRDVPPVEAEAASTFQHDNAKGGETYVVSDAFEKALPDIQWLPWLQGRQVVFASEPLVDDLMVLGHASADLWIQSTAEDADLEVTLSEIRPDGREAYVTSGWLRASQRTLTPDSTPLRPLPTRLESDLVPLPAGQWEMVRIEIYPFGHVFRAGSQLRLEISTPGANKGRWKFDVLQFDEPVTHAVSHSAAHASSILLPVIPGVAVPDALPACPGLRSQPCREYVPHVNAQQ